LAKGVPELPKAPKSILKVRGTIPNIDIAVSIHPPPTSTTTGPLDDEDDSDDIPVYRKKGSKVKFQGNEEKAEPITVEDDGESTDDDPVVKKARVAGSDIEATYLKQVDVLKLSDDDSYMRKEGFFEYRKVNRNRGRHLALEGSEESCLYALRYLLTVAAAVRYLGENFWIFLLREKTSFLHFPLACNAHFQSGTAQSAGAWRTITFVYVRKAKVKRAFHKLDDARCSLVLMQHL
jgi:ribosomal protein L21